jgi:type III pantothenate kinase
MIAEIDGVAEQYQKMEARLKVVMTGGDADFFLYQLKSRIFAVPDLTLIGLNAILDYQHT